MITDPGPVLQGLLSGLAFDNPSLVKVLIPCGIAFLGGYLVYAFCLLILAKEKTSCYPYWMHTFYFACDFLGCIFWAKLATMTNNFWAFWAFSACMAIWVVLEIISMYFSNKYERQEVFGRYFKGEVTMKKAALPEVAQIIMWMCVIANFVHYMGGYTDAAFFKLYFWTNLMVPLGAMWHWMRRGVKLGNRLGAGLALTIMVLVTILITWTPAGIGMWCTISDYFWTPTCIVAGVMTTIFSAWTIWYQTKLAPKPIVVEGKKPLP
ncbi:MAG: hypothetical protein IJG53_07720 [Eggerthellaceae bacterium]|nr:hypothetical protein [Eggerthellaceae bacterium]